MSDLDRAPLIRMQIDQEVFVDSVREGDTIEDATVATEVTSFDRVGDAYVLEGAIVFAGYLKRSPGAPGEQGDYANRPGSDSGWSGEKVKHVQHRMPFVLRVPMKAQPRGLVNVASRITSWNLQPVSNGWMQVTADLNIVGLNGQEGYHFQCGGQEVGNVMFEESWSNSASPDAQSASGEFFNPLFPHAKAVSQSGQAPFEGGTEESVEAVPSSLETSSETHAQQVHDAPHPGTMDEQPMAESVGKVQSTEKQAPDEQPLEAMYRGESDPSEDGLEDHSVQVQADTGDNGASSVQPDEQPAGMAMRSMPDSAKEAVEERTDAVNAARGGHDSSDSSEANETLQKSENWSAARELADFDRVFAGDSQASRAKEPFEASVQDSSSKQGVSDNSQSDDAFDKVSEPSDQQLDAAKQDWAEFEFEHQLNAGELETPQDKKSTSEEFVPSRSFSESGFNPASGFVPNVTIGKKSMRGDSDIRGPETADSKAYGTGEEGLRGEKSVPSPVQVDGLPQDAESSAEMELSSNLWSFVDFNGPEPRYTLRYVVVMEEETLDVVAERVGCHKAELVRINHLLTENVHAGQMLRVPGTVVPAL